MELCYKDIAPASSVNGNESVKGGWVFEKMDYAALTILSETFMHKIEGVAGVTNSADIKYLAPVFPHDYVEIYAKITNISPANLSVYTEMKSRSRKSSEWITTSTANFNFTLIKLKNRRIFPVPKEIINEIKR